jgi:hypothetical protein
MYCCAVDRTQQEQSGYRNIMNQKRHSLARSAGLVDISWEWWHWFWEEERKGEGREVMVSWAIWVCLTRQLWCLVWDTSWSCPSPRMWWCMLTFLLFFSKSSQCCSVSCLFCANPPMHIACIRTCHWPYHTHFSDHPLLSLPLLPPQYASLASLISTSQLHDAQPWQYNDTTDWTHTTTPVQSEVTYVSPWWWPGGVVGRWILSICRSWICLHRAGKEEGWQGAQEMSVPCSLAFFLCPDLSLLLQSPEGEWPLLGLFCSMPWCVPPFQSSDCECLSFSCILYILTHPPLCKPQLMGAFDCFLSGLLNTHLPSCSSVLTLALHAYTLPCHISWAPMPWVCSSGFLSPASRLNAGSALGYQDLWLTTNI